MRNIKIKHHSGFTATKWQSGSYSDPSSFAFDEFGVEVYRYTGSRGSGGGESNGGGLGRGIMAGGGSKYFGNGG